MKDNLTTLFLTWQQTSEMVSVHELKGGSYFPPPFDRVARSLEDITSLNFFNLFHAACMVSHTDYRHKLAFASLGPVVAITLNGVIFKIYERKPPIGERPLGRVMSAEQESRDWLELTAMQYTSMLLVFTFPTAMKVYAVSFVCTNYDDGSENGVNIMAADLSMDCDTPEYRFVRVMAIVSCVVLVVLFYGECGMEWGPKVAFWLHKMSVS